MSAGYPYAKQSLNAQKGRFFTQPLDSLWLSHKFRLRYDHQGRTPELVFFNLECQLTGASLLDATFD